MNSHTVVPVGPKKQEKSLTSSLNSLSINLQTKEDDRTLRHFSALSTITSFPCLETRDYLLVVSRRPAFNCNCCLRVREGNGNPLQYSCLENPMDGGEPGGLQSMGSLRVGHDWATTLSLFTFLHWRRKWQPTPVFLPGESQGWGAWWAVVYGVAQSRTRLKRFSSSSSSSCLWVWADY